MDRVRKLNISQYIYIIVAEKIKKYIKEDGIGYKAASIIVSEAIRVLLQSLQINFGAAPEH
jgi:hypothetical protein